jgi:hypothetical protein
MRRMSRPFYFFSQAARLFVLVSTIALLGLMFLPWSPTLLTGFLVAGLLLLLLARSPLFFRLALIVL